MASPNFNLAPYCYLSKTATGYDISIVVPHGAGYTITFSSSAPDDADYSHTNILIIQYNITKSSDTNLYTSKVYTNVFSKATAAKKIVQVTSGLYTESGVTWEYFTILEDDDAVDTHSISGNIASNCPHIYLFYLILDGNDYPKGLIPFDNMGFDGASPENLVKVVTTTEENLKDTISIATKTTSGIEIKMLDTLDKNPGLPHKAGTITLQVSSGATETAINNKRKNHNSQPGFPFREPSLT